jgi:hypothetical protein
MSYCKAVVTVVEGVLTTSVLGEHIHMLQESIYFDEGLYHRISKDMLIVQRQANGMHLESISLFLSFEVGQTTSRRSGAGTAIAAISHISRQ